MRCFETFEIFNRCRSAFGERGLRRFIKEVVLFDEGDPILVYHYQNQPEVEMGVLK